MTLPLLYYYNVDHEESIIKWQQGEYTPYHGFFKIHGFEQYNFVLEFTHHVEPDDYDPCVDRSGFIKSPYNFKIRRPWKQPAESITLDQTFRNRVEDYINTGAKVNLFWSGGIDSTAIVVAFLKHCKDLSQLRIVYTDASCKENPNFFKLLTTYPVELYQLTFQKCINDQLDGVVCNGLSGDERTAEISQHMFYRDGCGVLFQPWQDFFVNKDVSSGFYDFFESWFATAGRPIRTLLEARWWFFTQIKSQPQTFVFPSFFERMFKPQAISNSFFDCDGYESFVFYNTDRIIEPNSTYQGNKKFLKQYILDFDSDQRYFVESVKIHSMDLRLLERKVTASLDDYWLFHLSDGQKKRTKNQPFVSSKELDAAFGNELDYLFNFGRSK